ncbi:MAG: ABC transporter ATP-binding protein [Eubacterium sp.]|nr:ABC transporter ATP-binding protein [Eubacterium sp.]
MTDEVVIKVEHVTMKFTLNKEKVDNLKEYFIRMLKGKLEYNNFVALNDINFEVKKGDRLAILGLNGAGKSTLLKTIVGVYKPTDGKITKKGVIAPLLELGAGFDPNYSGRENIYLYGAILGYSRSYIENKIDEIIEFSELGKFIEVPVKNYSSGMRARLGFSIATAVEPDILILDEVLSVGDAKFRKKSLGKVKAMFDRGVTVLFVSHSIEQVKAICNKAILLEHGNIIAHGDVDEVAAIYEEKTVRPKENVKQAVVVPITAEEKAEEKLAVAETKKAIKKEKKLEESILDEIAKRPDPDKRYLIFLSLENEFDEGHLEREEYEDEVKKLLEADLNAENCPYEIPPQLSRFEEAMLKRNEENEKKEKKNEG